MNEQAEARENPRDQAGLLKKLRSQIGTTLVELLSVVMLLGMLGAAMTTGMNIAGKSYSDAIRGTEKDILFSTLEYLLSYELRNTRNVTIDQSGNVLDIQAKSYGDADYSDQNPRRTFFGKNTKDGSRPLIMYGLNNGEEGDSATILSANAYPKMLGATVTAMTYDNATHYFHVTLTITYNTSAIFTQSFDVLNLYATEADIVTVGA